VADYRDSEQYAGQRVVVVGGGNSAVQVAYELAGVTVASRQPIQFMPQLVGGKDVHYWHTTTGFDDLPPHWLARLATGTLVLDTGDYAAALESGRMDRRPMFTAFDGDHIIWAWATSGWSSSGPSPPTPCAACTATPSTWPPR
jgi:putative flavoprotein involved in K+ transport